MFCTSCGAPLKDGEICSCCGRQAGSKASTPFFNSYSYTQPTQQFIPPYGAPSPETSYSKKNVNTWGFVKTDWAIIVYYICLSIASLLSVIFCVSVPKSTFIIVPIAVYLFIFPFVERRIFMKMTGCVNPNKCSDEYACTVLSNISEKIKEQERALTIHTGKIEIDWKRLARAKEDIANQREAEWKRLSHEKEYIENQKKTVEGARQELSAMEKELSKIVPYMNGETYERYVGYKIVCLGWREIAYTPASNDYGADIIAYTPQGEKVCIQCKRYSDSVGREAVQEIAAAKPYYGCAKAIVITNSTFTRQAKELARSNGVELVENFI